MSGDVILRDLSGMAEFLQAEALQRAVWGQDDTADPGDLMMVIQAEGGLCAGAFRDGRMLGYIFAFPTREPGVQHSHRLAVLTEARGLGLGVRLKWYQRDWCLARGIHLVRWTYDPARLPNASLNIGNLGATARTYYPDYYGAMAGINAGAPSDRLLADWHLAGPSATARAAGRAWVPDPALVTGHVDLPADFGGLLNDDPAQALAERLRIRASLQDAFARGEEIAGFDRARQAYILARRTD